MRKDILSINLGQPPLSPPPHGNEGWRQNLNDLHTFHGIRSASWWTGKCPSPKFCPGVDQQGIIRSLPLLNLNQCTRQTIQAYFDNTWALTDILFSCLQGEEAFYRPPTHGLRHPLIFYYAHPAVLYINKLRLAGLLNKPINAHFESYFAKGVDEMSWDDLSKNDLLWPRIEEITAYRHQVYQTISQLIATHPSIEQRPILSEHPFWALFLAMEHERIHLETSSVLIRELPLELVQRPPQWPEHAPLRPTTDTPKVGITHPGLELITIHPQTVILGKSLNWPSYGWDNEYGYSEKKVAAFQANRYLVTNGDFWEFVYHKGYHHRHYWTEEGWHWRCFRDTTHPHFWIPLDATSTRFQLRLCFEEVPMQWDWPVIVNYHEAIAFCNWKTEQTQSVVPYRLPTEAEYLAMQDKSAGDAIMTDGSQQFLSRKINLNLAYGSENSVTENSASQKGFHDIVGNVWSWSEDHFAPLPGFKTHYLYADFSTPCFDECHNRILGGSFIGTGDEASRWARFHFRRHFFQHAGFRLVQSKAD